MRVTLQPIIFQPVPVVRPVPRVGRSLVEGPHPQKVSEHHPGEGRSRRRRPGTRHLHEVDAAQPPDPAATLTATLAVLALDRAVFKA